MLTSRVTPWNGVEQGTENGHSFWFSRSYFSCKTSRLGIFEGIGEKGCNALKSWKKGLLSAEKKAREIKTLGIQCLFFGTPEYPLALSFCADAPLVLFYKGTLSFQDRSIVSIVGTRQNTPHGRAFCEELIQTLAPFCVP